MLSCGFGGSSLRSQPLQYCHEKFEEVFLFETIMLVTIIHIHSIYINIYTYAIISVNNSRM